MENIKNKALWIASIVILVTALNVTGVFWTFFSDKNDAPSGSICWGYWYQSGYGYGYMCDVPHTWLWEAQGIDVCPWNIDNSWDFYDWECGNWVQAENNNEENTQEGSWTNTQENNQNEENNNTETNTWTSTQENTQENVNNQSNTTNHGDYVTPNKFASCMIIKNILDPNYMPNYVNPFVDINNSLYKNTIISFAKVWIVHWTTPTTFEPFRGITRAEFLAIVIKTHCYNFDLGSDNPGFPDVSPTSWQAKVVKKWVALGIIHGYSDWTFKPNRVISKAEAYGIVSSMWIITSKWVEKVSYTDLEAKWQENMVKKLEYLGVLDPAKDNYKFHPNAAVNRDQMLDFIKRVISLY